MQFYINIHGEGHLVNTCSIQSSSTSALFIFMLIIYKHHLPSFRQLSLLLCLGFLSFG